MAFLENLQTKVRVYGHYIEQPSVIRKVGLRASWIGGLGGVAALTAADTWKAQPEERRQVLTRDALVLGSTALGTFLAARHLMPLPDVDDGVKVAKRFADDTLKVLAKDKDTYKDLIAYVGKLADKTKIDVADYKKIITEIKAKADPKTAKDHLAEIFEGTEEHPGFVKTVTQTMWQAGDFDRGIEEGEGHKMMAFFTVGGLSVISGLLGGIAANKINGVKDPNATVNMVKEGIFQFVANIALCAVGAASAIIAMSPEPIANALTKMGAPGKLLRVLGIGTGLSLGIFGGGAIANILGRKVINPLCDKLQGKASQPEVGPNQGKRKIEFWDAILHLDDVPTALALAGMEIVEPFIPLFFGFSGYRTGIGYRNDDSAKKPKAPPAPEFQALPPDSPSPATVGNTPDNIFAQAPSQAATSSDPLADPLAANAGNPINNFFTPDFKQKVQSAAPFNTQVGSVPNNFFTPDFSQKLPTMAPTA